MAGTAIARSSGRKATREALLAAGAAMAATLFVLPALAADAEWDQVVAAAKKEGRVVVYAGVTTPMTGAVGEAFEKKYGIKVDLLFLRSSEVRERIRTEQASGVANADVTINSASTETLQKEAGTFQPHGYLPNSARTRPPFKDDGYLMPVVFGRWGLLINTNLVKPEDEPKSWKDVLDPKWAGKILMDDPRINGGGHVFFTATYDRFGREFHEKIAAMKPEISRETRVADRRVAQGEFAIYYPFTLSNLPNLQGLPLKAIVPEEGAPYLPFATAMLKGAPRPNAARLYMNFYLENEAQELEVHAGFQSPVGWQSSSLSPSLKPFQNTALLGTAPADRQAPMMKLAAEIYK